MKISLPGQAGGLRASAFGHISVVFIVSVRLSALAAGTFPFWREGRAVGYRRYNRLYRLAGAYPRSRGGEERPPGAASGPGTPRVCPDPNGSGRDRVGTGLGITGGVEPVFPGVSGREGAYHIWYGVPCLPVRPKGRFRRAVLVEVPPCYTEKPCSFHGKCRRSTGFCPPTFMPFGLIPAVLGVSAALRVGWLSISSLTPWVWAGGL